MTRSFTRLVSSGIACAASFAGGAALAQDSAKSASVTLVPEARMVMVWATNWVADIPAGAELVVVPHPRAVKACGEALAYRLNQNHTAIACAYDFDRDGKFERINAAGGAASKIDPVSYRRLGEQGSDESNRSSEL